MSAIVVMPADELAALIRDAVAEALAAQTPAPAPTGLCPTTYYTVPELATLLGVSEGSIYREAREGNLPHIRVGTSIRICETALGQYQTGGAA